MRNSSASRSTNRRKINSSGSSVSISCSTTISALKVCAGLSSFSGRATSPAARSHSASPAGPSRCVTSGFASAVNPPSVRTPQPARIAAVSAAGSATLNGRSRKNARVSPGAMTVNAPRLDRPSCRAESPDPAVSSAFLAIISSPASGCGDPAPPPLPRSPPNRAAYHASNGVAASPAVARKPSCSNCPTAARNAGSRRSAASPLTASVHVPGAVSSTCGDTENAAAISPARASLSAAGCAVRNATSAHRAIACGAVCPGSTPAARASAVPAITRGGRLFSSTSTTARPTSPPSSRSTA